MLLDAFYILVIFIVSVALVCLAIFIVAFAFLGDLDTTVFVLKDSIAMSFSKKKQRNSIQSTTVVANILFRKTAEEVSGMSEKELVKKINISKEEAKKFKKSMTEILKTPDVEFVSEEDVLYFMKKNHNFGFIQQLTAELNQYSQPKFNYLRKTQELHKQGKMNDEELFKNWLKISNKTDKQLKIEIDKLKRKNKNPSIRDFSVQMVQKIISSDENVNINTLYSSVS